MKLKWQKRQVFNLVFYYAQCDKHTSRMVFDIDKTDNEFPYKLSIMGNYKGHFKTLNNAKDFAQQEANKWLSE